MNEDWQKRCEERRYEQTNKNLFRRESGEKFCFFFQMLTNVNQILVSSQRNSGFIQRKFCFYFNPLFSFFFFSHHILKRPVSKAQSQRSLTLINPCLLRIAVWRLWAVTAMAFVTVRWSVGYCGNSIDHAESITFRQNDDRVWQGDDFYGESVLEDRCSFKSAPVWRF